MNHMPKVSRERKLIWLFILAMLLSCFWGPARDHAFVAAIIVMLGLSAGALWWFFLGRNR